MGFGFLQKYYPVKGNGIRGFEEIILFCFVLWSWLLGKSPANLIDPLSYDLLIGLVHLSGIFVS